MKDTGDPGANGNLPACGGIATGNIYGHLAERLLLAVALPEAQDRCVSRAKTPGVCSITHSLGSEPLLLVKTYKRH